MSGNALGTNSMLCLSLRVLSQCDLFAVISIPKYSTIHMASCSLTGSCAALPRDNACKLDLAASAVPTAPPLPLTFPLPLPLLPLVMPERTACCA
eukprot:2623704-Rhodomonas_salina.1